MRNLRQMATAGRDSDPVADFPGYRGLNEWSVRDVNEPENTDHRLSIGKTRFKSVLRS